MGLTKVKVVVKSLETGIGKEVELIVDTGSVFAWISRSVLEELGVKPRRVRQFKTIDGRVVTREIGVVTIKYEDYEGDVEVVFAEKGDAQVLGVTTLETLGLEVDPVTGKLKYIGHLAL
ncbi:MAG: aspartyl protease family protein [archaeon YNP-LCB-003-016]|jgi:clan AA aspartic protease|uniref:aspartyl protease family protein n=1 Tax=Candidatus Culexarchaeum yellowstonense TaxID=2928963 RepID=UPI0026F30952|nr:aspartyl protease family protein [Candidatus Culexarchaeum yellowstonense]MCR6691265.1 aspartyl protease family protein [Candidatus Culexarchaeum yellowstonense]